MPLPIHVLHRTCKHDPRSSLVRVLSRHHWTIHLLRGMVHHFFFLLYQYLVIVRELVGWVSVTVTIK